MPQGYSRVVCRGFAEGRSSSMKATFWTYWAVIAAGIAVYALVGATHS
ncbi:MAG TPA: hypothetical protein VM204_06100 [Gaiellaceae bacterium]|nr:hypothetical protein [Gaiellaceae bacterium]